MTASLVRKLFGRATSFSRQAQKREHFRPWLDLLESRTVPATLLVNDNWVVTTDVAPTGLSSGDTVSNSADTGATAVTGTFGTTAFATINDAVAAASSGDTIRVLQGTYTGNVTIDESVTLEGANANVAAGLSAGTRGAESAVVGAITVTADNVTISGLKIQNGANIGGDVAGIFLAAGASDITIKNNVITGADTGRGILSSFNGENNNLTIRENDISGWTTAIFNQSNENVDVLSNLIHDNVSGVANDFVEGLLIQGNDFSGNDEAIGTFESTDVVVRLNDLAGNTMAIANYGGDDVNASMNFFGTTDPDEIADLVSGGVITDQPLGSTITATTHVYSGDGAVLVVDSATGAYTLTLDDGTTYSGTGARIQNGKLKIHDQSSQGKVDVNGNADGSVTVNLRGRNKMDFQLDSAA